MSNPYQDFEDDRFGADDDYDSFDATNDAEIEYQSFGQPRQNKPWFWMAGCGCLVAMLLCCGICGGLASLGYQQIKDEVQTELQNNPVVEENIGEIQKLDVQWRETFADERDNYYVFKITGDKASGTVTVHLKDVGINEPEEIQGGTLVLESGEQFDLKPNDVDENN